VARFVADDAMAGRVLLWWTGDEPRLIPVTGGDSQSKSGKRLRSGSQ
jgi:hypothetical protein